MISVVRDQTVQPVRGSVHVHSEVRQRRSGEVPVRPTYQDRAHRTAPATKSRPGIAPTQDRAAQRKGEWKAAPVDSSRHPLWSQAHLRSPLDPMLLKNIVGQ
jgi:hypothetical protein